MNFEEDDRKSSTGKDVRTKVLLTSSGRKLPMYRALNEAAARVDRSLVAVAGDISELNPILYAAEEFWRMPPTDSLDRSKLVSMLVERQVTLVIPSRNGELRFWSAIRDDLLSAGIDVVISEDESLRFCLDKFEFWSLGQEMGLPFIPTSLVEEDWRGSSLVVKERFGSGSKNLHLDVSKKEAKKIAQNLEKPIFQPYVSGEEISIDAYLDKSTKVHGLVLRKRDLVRHGESVITTTFRNQELECQAREILEALRLRGPVVMQGLITSSGLRIIEVNPRFGGASTASISVGLDSLFWVLLEHLFPNQPLPPFIRLDKEIRSVRISRDVVLDWQ